MQLTTAWLAMGILFIPRRAQWHFSGRDGQEWCSAQKKFSSVWKCWTKPRISKSSRKRPKQGFAQSPLNKRRMQAKKKKKLRVWPFGRPCLASISTGITRKSTAVVLPSRRGRRQHSLRSKSMTGGCSGRLCTTCWRTSQDSEVATNPPGESRQHIHIILKQSTVLLASLSEHSMLRNTVLPSFSPTPEQFLNKRRIGRPRYASSSVLYYAHAVNADL
mmetsp:Transcript_101711/g.183484  ORF Transcript_101711/g.183484 Transcript_101711/m.183484 type:complete len:218 (+) Transcript_101711:78-731(+)